ncbi:MAG: glucose-1-phosphate cytidylyltransferase, partial [Candidatus Margulisiibacteriota bacterium]
YSHYGFNDFVICLGYKGYVIKEYFANYFLHQSDVTFDLSKNQMQVHGNYSEPWKVTLVETGLNTMTGGRIRRIQPFIGQHPFMLTYGDGVADVNINDLLSFHKAQKKKLTITAVKPEGRFGILDIREDGSVERFIEKPEGDLSRVNGGFFVCEPEVFDAIPQSDDAIFERIPLETLAKENKISAYKHQGFWKCMDTLRDKQQLESMWQNNSASWKVWK